jgi:AbrB family looped-hinge helix DNA binding protein
MSIVGKITSKGQTTVPMEIRDILGVSTGDHLEYVVGDDKSVTIRRAKSLMDLHGLLKSEVSVSDEEMVRLVHDARDARARELLDRMKS